MEKTLINDNEKLKRMLIDCGVSEHVFYHASKMDVSVVSLFKDKIIDNYSLKTKEEVTKSLLGVYGNFIATSYCKHLYKNVQNEVSIKDEAGKELTRADISYVDNYGELNYCEVKAAHQIIDNIRNYVDEDAQTGAYEDKNQQIIKYKNIGKKLISQVEKLSSTGKKVNVFIFKGCYVDDVIKRKLKDLGASLHVIMVDVKELEDEISNLVTLVREKLKSKMVINKDDLLATKQR